MQRNLETANRSLSEGDRKDELYGFPGRQRNILGIAKINLLERKNTWPPTMPPKGRELKSVSRKQSSYIQVELSMKTTRKHYLIQMLPKTETKK